jgi:hypothetical protein
MATRFVGSGRAKEGGFLATHKQDFVAHRTGGDWRHKADQVDMNPQLADAPGATVQQVLANLGIVVSSKLITVGDGTNSVGDFSGPDAIQRAIESVRVGSDPWTAVILVKHGLYVITSVDGVDITERSTLVLIGEGSATDDPSESTVIQDNRSDSLNGAISVNGSLYCDRIWFIGGTADDVAIHIDRNLSYGTDSIIEARNCTFNGCGIRIFSLIDNTRVRFINCNFNGSGIISEYTFCLIKPRVIGNHDGVEFETCFFELENGVTAATVEAANITYSSICSVSYVRFRGCRIDISAILTSPDHNGATQGPIAIREYAGIASAGDFQINEITFEDCDVLSKKRTSGYSMLLYLYLDYRMVVNNFTIRGGRWITSALGTSNTSPFYIGGSLPALPLILVDRVCIENIEMGWGLDDSRTFYSYGEDYGGPPSEITSSGSWPAFYVQGKHIRVNNWHIRGTTRFGSTRAELIIKPWYDANVDGIYIDDFSESGTPGSLPTYRIKLYAAGVWGGTKPQTAIYRNIIFDMGAWSVDDIDLGTIIEVSSNSGGYPVVLDSCQVLNTRVNGGFNGGVGFYCNTSARAHEFINCVARKNKIGFSHVLSSTFSIGGVIIRGGLYEDNYEYGIIAYTDGDYGDTSAFKIIGATVKSNGVDPGNPGIYLRAGSYSNVSKGWIVLNNTVTDNNSNVHDPQITIGDVSITPTPALIMGNDCMGASPTPGKIRVLTSNSYRLSGFGVYSQFPAFVPTFFDFPTVVGAAPLGGVIFGNLAEWTKT